MRFALFTTNLSGGGAEKALAKIAGGLAARGHEVDFLVCEDTGHHAPPSGCRFTALAARAGHGWLGKRRLAWKLGRMLEARRPDLLVSTLPFADEIAVLAHAPHHVCRIANTLSAEIARLPAAKAQRRRDRYRTLYAGRRLVAVSHGVAADLRNHFRAESSVIVNPFDLAAIRIQAAEPCPLQPDEPYLLHVGRFAAQKRHDLLLEAFSRLDYPRRLVLLTPPDSRLETLIAQHGFESRVTIADFQANPYPWMAGAELLVLCSDHEGLPNVLIEALACGTRVVSTDCPSGPREILTGELAKGLVACNDADMLAGALRNVLAGPRPTQDEVAAALAPYDSECVLDAWETLAGEHA